LYHLFLLCAAPRRLAPARAAAAMLALRAVVREAERVHRRGAGDASLKASCLSELLSCAEALSSALSSSAAACGHGAAAARAGASRRGAAQRRKR